MPRPQQTLLPLEGRRPDRFDAFVAGPNQAAVTTLRDLLDRDSGGVFLRGPEGTGKTHLLNALCNEAPERGRSAFYIAPGSLPPHAAEGLAGLEDFDLVCVDDIDRVAGQPGWEEALFHSFNRIRDRNGRLVVSSRLPLGTIPFGLPDLRSRLGWGLRLALEPLDDAAKAEVLIRRARTGGIELPGEVARYLLSRGSRNLADLTANLEAVRVAALSGKRRITLPLVREVLKPDA